MEKAVVTGALGFIGFHLCHRLLAEGIEVTAIDDLSDEPRKEEKEEKLNYFGRNALFTFLDRGMENFSFDEAIKGSDVCFHLAGSPLVCGTEELRKRIDDVAEALYEVAETSVSRVQHGDTPIRLKCRIDY